MNNENIAIIGGGFAGLCVISNLIQLSKKKKKHLHITLFDPNNVPDGVAYNTDLSDSFKINHEACYMGIVSPFNKEAQYDDFYLWIQENKNKKLSTLEGISILEKYKNFDISDPNSYLPRSLYGYYLKHRFEELILNSGNEGFTFTYRKFFVKDIIKNGDMFKVFHEDTYSFFKTVVLSTGDVYNYSDKNLYYSSKPNEFLNNKKLLYSSKIGILGSSLSAIETALALAEKGCKYITLFSRNGRLPRVRGKTSLYKPKYITLDLLTELKGNSGTIEPNILIQLLKKEFDFAYKEKHTGLYQKEGINWKEIILNSNPLKQLEEDIKTVQLGKDVVWRSVLFSLNDIEMDFWRSLSVSHFKEILKKYTSLILLFFSPMPLVQAEKLLSYMKSGIIRLKANVSSHRFHNEKWIISLKTDEEMYIDYLIDARGYSQDGSQNSLIASLIHSGLLEKHPVYGIRANEKFQIIKENVIENNLYAIGSMLNGERPLKASTPYITEFAKVIANNILEGQV